MEEVGHGQFYESNAGKDISIPVEFDNICSFFNTCTWPAGTTNSCTVKGGLLGQMTWQFLNVLELFSP